MDRCWARIQRSSTGLIPLRQIRAHLECALTKNTRGGGGLSRFLALRFANPRRALRLSVFFPALLPASRVRPSNPILPPDDKSQIASYLPTRLRPCPPLSPYPTIPLSPCSLFKASSTGVAMISRTRSRSAGTSSLTKPLVSMVSCRRTVILAGHSIQWPVR